MKKFQPFDRLRKQSDLFFKINRKIRMNKPIHFKN